MKKIILLLAAVMSIAVSQAQQDNYKGFYINPNVKFQKGINFPRNEIMINPEINLGYLIKKNKFRHHFSLNGLQGALSKSNAYGTINLRYAFDFQLLQRKNFTLFASPFISTNMVVAKSKFNGDIYRNSAFQIQSGIIPQAEIKLSKRLDFVVSTPITLGTFNSGQSYSRMNQNENRQSFVSWNQGAPSIQANIGIRLNLFQKK